MPTHRQVGKVACVEVFSSTEERMMMMMLLLEKEDLQGQRGTNPRLIGFIAGSVVVTAQHQDAREPRYQCVLLYRSTAINHTGCIRLSGRVSLCSLGQREGLDRASELQSQRERERECVRESYDEKKVILWWTDTCIQCSLSPLIYIQMCVCVCIVCQYVPELI